MDVGPVPPCSWEAAIPQTPTAVPCLPMRLGSQKPSFARCWSRTFAAFICNVPFAGGPQFPSALLWYGISFVGFFYIYPCSPPSKKRESTLHVAGMHVARFLVSRCCLPPGNGWIHREHKKKNLKKNQIVEKAANDEAWGDIGAIKTGFQSLLSMGVSHH